MSGAVERWLAVADDLSDGEKFGSANEHRVAADDEGSWFAMDGTACMEEARSAEDVQLGKTEQSKREALR